MNRDEIKQTFEAFFEKYKKTEGDESSWSAHWTERMPSGADVTINLTKCPAGNIFKIFKNDEKLGELNGWDAFFEGVGDMLGDDWDEDAFFGAMRDMT
jgi:hypothetical protein